MIKLSDSDFYDLLQPKEYYKMLKSVNARLNYRWGEFPYGGHMVHYPFMNRVHLTVRYLTGWDRDMFKYVLNCL